MIILHEMKYLITMCIIEGVSSNNYYVNYNKYREGGRACREVERRERETYDSLAGPKNLVTR